MTILLATLICIVIFAFTIPFLRKINTNAIINLGKTLIIASGVLLIQKNIESEYLVYLGLIFFVIGFCISIMTLFLKNEK